MQELATKLITHCIQFSHKTMENFQNLRLYAQTIIDVLNMYRVRKIINGFVDIYQLVKTVIQTQRWLLMPAGTIKQFLKNLRILIFAGSEIFDIHWLPGTHSKNFL